MTARSLPFVLSVIAGATDIIGVPGLDGLFKAHITGNLVLLAACIVVGRPASVAYILSVPVFMLVLLATGLVARAIERFGKSSLQLLLLLQLLALAAFLSQSSKRRFSDTRRKTAWWNSAVSVFWWTNGA